MRLFSYFLFFVGISSISLKATPFEEDPRAADSSQAFFRFFTGLPQDIYKKIYHHWDYRDVGTSLRVNKEWQKFWKHQIPQTSLVKNVTNTLDDFLGRAFALVPCETQGTITPEDIASQPLLARFFVLQKMVHRYQALGQQLSENPTWDGLSKHAHLRGLLSESGVMWVPSQTVSDAQMIALMKKHAVEDIWFLDKLMTHICLNKEGPLVISQSTLPTLAPFLRALSKADYEKLFLRHMREEEIYMEDLTYPFTHKELILIIKKREDYLLATQVEFWKKYWDFGGTNCAAELEKKALVEALLAHHHHLFLETLSTSSELQNLWGLRRTRVNILFARGIRSQLRRINRRAARGDQGALKDFWAFIAFDKKFSLLDFGDKGRGSDYYNDDFFSDLFILSCVDQLPKILNACWEIRNITYNTSVKWGFLKTSLLSAISRLNQQELNHQQEDGHWRFMTKSDPVRTKMLIKG
jgi:hypothetical protein